MRDFDDSSEMDDEAGPGLDFARAFSVVRRGWLWIILATFVCAGLSFAATKVMTTKYTASAVVQIDPRAKPLTNLEGIISEIKADAATIESEVEIIGSRAIAKRVIEALKLRDDPEFNTSSGALGSVVTDLLGGLTGNKQRNGQTSLTPSSAPDTSAAPGDAVVAAFKSRLGAKRVRTTLLIEITFSSNDPVKASRIANAVAEVYLSEQLHGKRRAVQLASTLLEDKITALRDKVSAAERKVSKFKIEYGMFSSEGYVLSEKALARLMEQTVNARNTTAQARAKFQHAQELHNSGKGGAALADVLKSHTVRLMKEKLADAERGQAELATRYGERHPEMQKARAEVANARSRLATEVGKEVAALENSFRQAKLRETELLEDLEKSKANEAGVKEQSSVLAQYERDAKTSRQLLEALLGRFKQANESEDLQLPDARIVEQADVPLSPSSPKVKKIVAISSAGGLALALMIILALEFATSGLGRPEEVEHVLDLAHLSSLPLLSSDGPRAGDPMRSARLMIADPSGGYADAIRSVRRELDMQRAFTGSRVVLVAGSLPGEGSSAIASNLAHHYALTGQSVLLIDGDVRRAGLTMQLAPARTLGLMDVLARSIPVEQAILHDGTTGLNFLPALGAGARHNVNPELLSMPVMAHQIAHLKTQFNIIVVDAPPLLPVLDGRVLADYADQILFVMGWRSTPKAMAKRALKALSVNERKIVGVVVNHVDRGLLKDAPGFAAQSLGGADSTRNRYAA